MIVGVDDITHLNPKVMFDKITDGKGLFRQGQGINDDGPLGANHHTRSNLCIDLTLEPKDIFRNTFAMHKHLFRKMPKSSTNEGQKSRKYRYWTKID